LSWDEYERGEAYTYKGLMDKMEAWGCEGDGGWSEDVGQGWHCARVIRQYR